MKILFSTDQIYLHGGLEKVMAQKANYFADVLNYEVFILTTEQNDKLPCYSLSSKIKLIDINVNYYREKSYFDLSNLKKIPQHYKNWRNAVQSINPNVVIVCNYAFDFYWVPFFNSQFKTIKEYHSSRYFINEARTNANFIKKIKYKINDYFESKYHNIVLLNKDEKPFYKTKNTIVINNPIELNNKTASLQNKKAIAAGRIAPVKGFENLINTWAIVTKNEPTWQLDIYGQGDENYIQSLQELIIKNNLQNHVFLQPATSDLLTTMLDYSMYIMSSQTECFPMVLLESLTVGLPIVSFNCPTGPKNIVTNNEDGFIVENKNIQQLANKICYLIQNENTRINFGKNAKINSKKFNLQTTMQKWETLFAK